MVSQAEGGRIKARIPGRNINVPLLINAQAVAGGGQKSVFAADIMTTQGAFSGKILVLQAQTASETALEPTERRLRGSSELSKSEYGVQLRELGLYHSLQRAFAARNMPAYTPRVLESGVVADMDGRAIGFAVENVGEVSLRSMIHDQEGRPLPTPTVLQYAWHLTRALRVFEEFNPTYGPLVNRDFTADHVRIRPDGSICIIDLGSAFYEKGEGGQGGFDATPAYAAPEVYLAEDYSVFMPKNKNRSKPTVDRRTNQYNLGLILWEMATGLNYEEYLRERVGSDSEIMIHIAGNAPERLAFITKEMEDRDVPNGLQKIILKLLQRSQDDRYPRMADVQAEIEEAVQSN